MEQEQQGRGSGVFVKLNGLSVLFKMFHSLFNGKKEQLAVVAFTSKGLRTMVETQAKSMHAAAYLNRENFAEYELVTEHGADAEVVFKVNMGMFLKALSVYGQVAFPTTSLQMEYTEDEATLKMLLVEGSSSTDVRLQTMDPDDLTAYEPEFNKDPVVGKCILTSEALYDALKELCEQPQASILYLIMSSKEPYLRMYTGTGFGSCTVDIKNSSESVVSFEVQGQEPVTFSYNLRTIALGLRALVQAEQTFLRVNSKGMLSFAHKLPGDSGSHIVTNFFFMPNEEAEEGEGGEGSGGAAAPRKDAEHRGEEEEEAEGGAPHYGEEVHCAEEGGDEEDEGRGRRSKQRAGAADQGKQQQQHRDRLRVSIGQGREEQQQQEQEQEQHYGYEEEEGEGTEEEAEQEDGDEGEGQLRYSHLHAGQRGGAAGGSYRAAEEEEGAEDGPAEELEELDGEEDETAYIQDGYQQQQSRAARAAGGVAAGEAGAMAGGAGADDANEQASGQYSSRSTGSGVSGRSSGNRLLAGISSASTDSSALKRKVRGWNEQPPGFSLSSGSSAAGAGGAAAGGAGGGGGGGSARSKASY